MFSNPTTLHLRNVNESIVRSAIDYLNKNSPTQHTYASGRLISAQKVEELPYTIYKLTFNLNPLCKEAGESCPEETCTIDLKQDEFGTTYVQENSIQCSYLYPQSSQDDIIQEQSKEFKYKNDSPIENLNKQVIGNGSFTLDDEIKSTGDQNDATFIAVKSSNNNYCVGCPYDLNIHLPGLLAFKQQIEKQMDEVMPNDFKHMVLSIVRATRAVPPSSNVVQYQLLVEIGESNCLKTSSSSDCILQSNIPIKTCLVTFNEKPWQRDSRIITKNNCTTILSHEAVQSLINESYMEQHNNNNNAFEGLKSILVDDLTHTSTFSIDKHDESSITEHPFVKVVLNKSKDEENSEHFIDKEKEFDKFLEDFNLPVKTTTDSSKIEQTPITENIILPHKVTMDDENNIINEIVNQLNTNTVQTQNEFFDRKKRLGSSSLDDVAVRVKRVGEPASRDVTDPEIVQYANHGLTKLSQLSEEANEPIIVEITHATRQVVSGLLYKINVKIGTSDCPKGTKNNCQLKTGSDTKDCLFTIWSRPWIDHGSPDIQINCTPNTRRKRSLKGAYYNQKMLAQAQRIKHERMFEEFIVNFDKNYSSDEEKEHRFKIFEENLRVIQKLRMYEQGTAEYGVTMFADLTPEEFKEQYLGFRTDLRLENQIPFPQAKIPNIQLPTEFDWRHYNAVTPVKDQGSCGSCWAFSVTGNIEGQYAVKYGKLLSLSEQELMDCDNLDKACNGGLPDNAYRAIENLGGLESESDYPYEAKQEKCHFNKQMTKVQIVSALNITSDETEMAQWLVQNGPISIGINANAMQFYFGGISHPWKFLCNPDDLDHGVLIVGYGIHKYPLFKKEMPYWIIKNSWGSRWGEQGYYRVYRGDGTCGLNKSASSAVVA